MKLTILIAVAATLAAVNLASAQESKLPPASTKENITYATDIKPLFDANCVKCHSGDKPKAHLKLDTLEGVLKGNKWGPVVKAGAAADSIVVKAIAHQTKDHDGWMPPMPNRAGAKTLTPEQIGLVIGWINQGAK
jgi:mono/diheme cytochrome c family protein